ncbi:hypothetical protein [Arsenicicoccus dermatophilus]|uniref:hypothetical protein n=1 Tax=Arsenicicoccus dermatophilus TaxID=1076331 RepID=UPI0039170E67
MARRYDDNPARRLEAVLERYAEVLPERRGSGYDAVWVETLQLDGSYAVTLAVAQAFSLIPEIAKALTITDDPANTRLFHLFASEWSKPFLPTNSGRDQVVGDAAVSEHAMAALSSIASHLQDNLPEGPALEEMTVTDWREQILPLIEDLRDDAGLPPQDRALLIARLHDILWALDHVDVMGTEGVRAATERLAMAYLHAHLQTATAAGDDDASATTEDPLMTQVKSLLTVLYQGLQAPGSIYATWELLGPAVQALTGG